MKCEICRAEHELLDPAFKRPDDVFSMPERERKTRVRENNDACTILATTSGEKDRFFIRCTLSVPLHDSDDEAMWGVWAEVAEQDFEVISERWSDPDQDKMPPMPSTLANRIAGYPDTRGIPLLLQLTGPQSRPALVFADPSAHPFALECQQGVTVHRVVEWLETIR